MTSEIIKGLKFSLIRRPAVVAGVEPAEVVEARDIGQQTLFELTDGLVAVPAQLLLFQILKKAFHNRVAVWMPFRRK